MPLGLGRGSVHVHRIREAEENQAAVDSIQGMQEILEGEAVGVLIKGAVPIDPTPTGELFEMAVRYPGPDSPTTAIASKARSRTAMGMPSRNGNHPSRSWRNSR